MRITIICCVLILVGSLSTQGQARGRNDYQDYLTVAAVALPDGSFPPDTITVLCSPKDWVRVMGNVPPPPWLEQRGAIVVGPFRHAFSCENIELRPTDDTLVVTLRSPSQSASIARGGCAIAVSPFGQKSLVIDGDWRWKQTLGTVQACGDTIKVPDTDYADSLRVSLRAREAIATVPWPLQGTEVQLIGPNRIFNRTAIAGSDGVAIFQQVPATAVYEVIIQPVGCGKFDILRQNVAAGRHVTLDIDLGTLTTLTVQVISDTKGGHAPLPDASVTVFPHHQFAQANTWLTGGNGQALLSCLPTDAKIDLRVSYPGHLPADLCGVTVGPGGQSQVDVVSVPNLDPRRRPSPPPCNDIQGQESPKNGDTNSP